MIGSKKEQRGLNEPAVRPIQPAQEVVVPQPVYALVDGVPGIGDPTRARTGDPTRGTTVVVPRVGSVVVPRVGSPVRARVGSPIPGNDYICNNEHASQN